MKEVIRLVILDKAIFVNEFCNSFTVVGVAGMFGSCCIRGHPIAGFSHLPGRAGV